MSENGGAGIQARSVRLDLSPEQVGAGAGVIAHIIRYHSPQRTAGATAFATGLEGLSAGGQGCFDLDLSTVRQIHVAQRDGGGVIIEVTTSKPRGMQRVPRILLGGLVGEQLPNANGHLKTQHHE